MRSLLLASLVLLSGCLGTTPQRVPEPEAPTGSDLVVDPATARFTFSSTERLSEIGLRIVIELTAVGACQLAQTAQWKMAPDDQRPYFLTAFNSTNSFGMFPNVIRTVAHAHAGPVDSRDLAPAPWITVVPEPDLEGHYAQSMRLGLGGRFAQGPIEFVIAGRDLLPTGGRPSFTFDLTCDQPVVLHALEAGREIRIFDMLSMSQGSGMSVFNHASYNAGDALRARLSGPVVRMVASDTGGAGTLRFEHPNAPTNWTLPGRWLEHEVGPGDVRLVLDRRGTGERNMLARILGSFRPIEDLSQLLPAP